MMIASVDVVVVIQPDLDAWCRDVSISTGLFERFSLMNTLISLLLTVLISPTLIDRSDLGNNCDSVLTRRTISQEAVNNGMVQGVVYADSVSAVGIVDARTATYEPCNEFGERFFRAGWVVSITLSASNGLSVIENGAAVFTQGRSYDAPSGVVRIQHQGNALRYYLNGQLVHISHRPDIASRDLRAYYFGIVERPVIGVQRKLSPVFLNLRWSNRGRTKR